MKRMAFVLLCVSTAAMVLALFAGAGIPTVGAQDDFTLAAVRVAADMSDPLNVAWTKSPTLVVALEPEVKDADLPTLAGVHFGPIPEVKLQAAYDDKTIWIRAIWPDTTMNSNMLTWTYDGKTWSQSKLRQDRLALAFDISGNAQFKALGCGAICHEADSTASEYMGFPKGSTDTVDVWQWKSGQSALVGYTDDQWLGAYIDDKGPKGPSNDASTGAVPTANKNKAGDAPAFMYPKGAMPGSPLFADNAVPFDPKATFDAGYTLPGYTVARPKGSRGDISATSFYLSDPTGKGWWYVVLSRPFTTGNPEDHVFALNGSNVFGVAVFNNSDNRMHAVKDKLNLTIGQ